MQRSLFDFADSARDPAAEIHTGCVGPIRYATTSASRDLIETVLTELLAAPAAPAAMPEPSDPPAR